MVGWGDGTQQLVQGEKRGRKVSCVELQIYNADLVSDSGAVLISTVLLPSSQVQLIPEVREGVF